MIDGHSSAPTETEKRRILVQRWKEARAPSRLYYIYRVEAQEPRQTAFTLIAGRFTRDEAKACVEASEASGSYLRVYCAHPHEHRSAVVYETQGWRDYFHIPDDSLWATPKK